VLYLAEVIQKKGGIIGGGKSELKLLACQRAEQNWSAVPGEDVVASEEASRFSGGTLVLVDLTASKQVQRVQEAGRPLVSILQNFSRLQEKFKTQEEEIEQWKQSLTYQSQELNRREMEMEARREQLQQLEEDFEQLEQQRQQFEVTREEVTRGQDEMLRNRQDLDQAWEHLRGEMRRLEERQSELQQASVLDEGQAQVIRELLNRISSTTVAAAPMQEQAQAAGSLLVQHQAILSIHWQTVQEQQQQSQQRQASIEHQAHDLQQRWQEWHQAQESLEQAKEEVKLQQSSLQLKQEYAQLLGLQIQNYEELHQQLYRVTEGVDSVNISAQVNLDALEKMRVEDLQVLAQELERDLQKSLQFVNGQEEELELKEKELDGLREKIRQANEFDRLSLESELADEQDAYQFLNETLVGQRRSLKEQEGILRQHKAVLARRQGKPSDIKDGGIDLGNVFSQMEAQRQQRAEELHRVENQLEQIRSAIQQAQEMVDRRTQEQEAARNDLKKVESDLQSQRFEAAQMMGRVTLYQEFLQPIQDTTDGLRHQIEGLTGVVAQIDGAGTTQIEAVSQMHQILNGLVNAPEFVAS
jgi:DNA repair exonuclease SbcCD ATPase subunit